MNIEGIAYELHALKCGRTTKPFAVTVDGEVIGSIIKERGRWAVIVPEHGRKEARTKEVAIETVARLVHG